MSLGHILSLFSQSHVWQVQQRALQDSMQLCLTFDEASGATAPKSDPQCPEDGENCGKMGFIALARSVHCPALQCDEHEPTTRLMHAHRPMAFTNAMLPHDVQDAHANGIPIATASRQAC